MAEVVKKLSFTDLKKKYAQGEKTSWVSLYDYSMAYYADQAGIDVLFVGDSSATNVLGKTNCVDVPMDQMVMMCAAVSRAAKRAFVVGDIPFGSYQISKEEAIRNAARFLAEGHVDAVKCEGGAEVAETIAAITHWGIPCHGHIGKAELMPEEFAAMSYADMAAKVLDDAISLEQAGVFALVFAGVPQQITELVQAKIKVPIISAGSGPAPGQILIGHDMLRFSPGNKPAFVKQYANIGEQMLSAFKAFNEEVKSGAYPGPEHCILVPETEMAKVKEVIAKRG